MEYVRTIRSANGCQNMWIALKRLVIICCGCLTCSYVFVQMGQLSVQYRCLYAVQARVYAYAIMVVAHHHAVVGYRAHPSGQRIVIGEDCATIAVATQVLRGEETSATYVAHRRGLFLATIAERIYGADGLARIFHDIQVMFLGECHQGFHVGALTEEMNGHNSFGLRRDGFLDCLHRDIHRVPIHIHHYGSQTQEGHHFCGCDKRKGWGDHLVAGL